MVGSTSSTTGSSRFLCTISEHRLPTEFFDGLLMGRQLADRDERSYECYHLCFGLESLMQPLKFQYHTTRCECDLPLKAVFTSGHVHLDA